MKLIIIFNTIPPTQATENKHFSVAFRIIYSADAEKHTKHIGKTARKGYNVKDDTTDKI